MNRSGRIKAIDREWIIDSLGTERPWEEAANLHESLAFQRLMNNAKDAVSTIGLFYSTKCPPRLWQALR